MASFLVLNQLAIRYRRYHAVARRNLVSSLGTVTTQVIGGMLGFRPGGLVAGLALGQLVGTGSLLIGSDIRNLAAQGRGGVTSAGRIVARYWRFPLLLAPAGLLNVLGLQLPLLLVAYFYGSAHAGWLGLTQRVLALPIMLIGQAVAQVYVGELSRDLRTNGDQASPLFSANQPAPSHRCHACARCSTRAWSLDLHDRVRSSVGN